MDFVKVEHCGDIFVVTLSRAKANAINEQLVDELQIAISGAIKDKSSRAVVLASDRPNFFSTGLDVNEVFQYSRRKMTEFFGRYIDLYESIYTLPKPIVAAIKGHAFAGGAILALACDARIMAQGSFKFALNEVNIGIVLPPGAARMAIDCVGFARARDIILSGDSITPERALEIGLAKEIVSPELVLQTALSHAHRFAEKPPAAFAAIKKLLRESGGTYQVGGDQKVLDEIIDSWFSPEAEKGKRALIDSLSPKKPQNTPRA